jgi:hypothetical protein
MAHGEHTKQLQALLAQFVAPLFQINLGVEGLLDRSEQWAQVTVQQLALKFL